MSIIRVRKDEKYFTASNEPFVDKRLSWESRGLIGYLLTKPNKWEIRMEDLEKQGPAGNHKLRRMLAELRRAGYMNRIRVTLEKGKFDWITELYESPSQNPRPQSSGRFSTSGSSTRGKVPDIVNTEGTSTEESTTKPNIFKLYEENIGPLTPMIADTLQDAEKTYAVEWIVEVIAIAVKHNKRNWAYCDVILKRWQTEGKDDGKKAEPKPAQKQTPPTPPKPRDPEKKLVKPEMFKRHHAGN